MSDSTKIADLPRGGEVRNNVVLETKEMRAPPSMLQQQPPPSSAQAPPIVPHNAVPGSLPEGMSAFAQAPMGGGVQVPVGGPGQLPSRDIPMATHQYTQDQQVKPNYIPSGPEGDYIAQHDSYESLLKKKQGNEKEQDQLDSLYSELQLPLMVMALFFFFQMPFFQKKLAQTLPSLFLKDGNPNVSGYLVKTAIFGASFYGITKATHYLSAI